MEHIERAGVHSGDSMAVYPAQGMTNEEVDTSSIHAIWPLPSRPGLMNVRYVIMRADGKANSYGLEVNPRASRTVPFISKVTGVPMVRLAVNCSLGKTLKEQGYAGGLWPRSPLVAVKAPVFSMSKLIGVDTYLGPEMKSTGEVMGVDRNLPAHWPGIIAADPRSSPTAAPASLSDRRKSTPVDQARLHEAGYTLYATRGTAEIICALGIPARVAKGLTGEHPNVLDVINEGLVHCVSTRLRVAGRRRRRMARSVALPQSAASPASPASTPRSPPKVLLAGSEAFNVLPINEYRDGRPHARRPRRSRYLRRAGRNATLGGRHRDGVEIGTLPVRGIGFAMRFGPRAASTSWSRSQRQPTTLATGDVNASLTFARECW